jgi:hypothetical protein
VKNDLIIKVHPIVKHIANYCGIESMTKRNMVNAMKMKKMLVTRSKQKYMSDFIEGTLLEATK